MAEPTTKLDCLDHHGNGLRVEFEKRGDRFTHTVMSLAGGLTRPLLQSEEGTPEELAPPSPPFAELHQQGELIFLSGATTIGHWSMSVCVREAALQFEIACRLREKIDRLGSTYCVLQEGCSVRESHITHLQSSSNTLLLTPREFDESGSYPTTVQWCYRVEPVD